MSNLLLTGLGWPFTWIIRIFLAIDTLIYFFVAQAYEVFMLVANAKLFDSNNTVIDRITTNIYTVLGVAMLFVFAYNILNLIINPDKLSDRSDNSVLGIIKNLVISLIIIALLPQIFNYTYKFQNRVLQSGVLSSIILGGTSADNGEADITNAGRNIAINLFGSFYYPIDSEEKPYTYGDCASDKAGKPSICDDYVTAMDNAVNNGSIWAFTENKTLAKALDDGDIKYLWLISAAAGVFAAYLFISFAIDVGVRVVKLGVLQVIAPIPVIMRITKPKGGIYDKWFKEITKTFLMVFERLIIIYFAIATISIFCGEHGLFANLPDNAPSTDILTRLLAKVILILGTLSFAKEAPKMLEDLFGMKIGEINIKKKLDENTYAKKLVGAGATAGLGAVGGAIRRFNAAKERGYGGWGRAGSLLMGGIGGLLGGGLRGVKADYGKGSEGFKNAIIGSHQSNMEQGVKNEATRRKLEGTGKAGDVVSKIPGVNIVAGTGSNIIDSVTDGFGEIKNIVGGKGLSALQTAIKAETGLKSFNTSFMDSNVNKGDAYNANKKAKETNYNDFVSGKISNEDLFQRLMDASTKFQREAITQKKQVPITETQYEAIIEEVVQPDGSKIERVAGYKPVVKTVGTKEVTEVVGYTYKYDGKTIDITNKDDIIKANADFYDEKIHEAQGKNLSNLVKDINGNADFAESKKIIDQHVNALKKQFNDIASSIPLDQREKISNEITILENKSFTDDATAAEFAVQLEKINKELSRNIQINNIGLQSSEGNKSK